jgi:hypothetical protein
MDTPVRVMHHFAAVTAIFHVESGSSLYVVVFQGVLALKLVLELGLCTGSAGSPGQDLLVYVHSTQFPDLLLHAVDGVGRLHPDSSLAAKIDVDEVPVTDHKCHRLELGKVAQVFVPNIHSHDPPTTLTTPATTIASRSGLARLLNLAKRERVRDILAQLSRKELARSLIKMPVLACDYFQVRQACHFKSHMQTLTFHIQCQVLLVRDFPCLRESLSDIAESFLVVESFIALGYALGVYADVIGINT